MAAPRGRKKKADDTPSMLKALEFIKPAQSDIGSPHHTHCILHSGWAVAFNGIVAMGHRIEEELFACPHTYNLIAALKRCSGRFSIGHDGFEKLTISSDKFRALIPCVNPAVMLPAAPDPQVAVVSDELRDAFNAIGFLAGEGGQTIVTASLLLRENSVLATDRAVMLEYWHGFGLPRPVVIPKAAIAAVCKIAKPLVGFGCSDNTASFIYEDGSWLRTQLFADPWPDVDVLLNVPSNPLPLPKDFYKAIDAIMPFSTDGRVRFRAGKLMTHEVEEVGASYAIDGLPVNIEHSLKSLKAIQPFAERIDFTGHRGNVYFFGGKVRGGMAGVVSNNPKQYVAPVPPAFQTPINDDEIPF